MKIQEVLFKGKKILIENNVEEASLVSRMLLSHILNCSKEELLLKYEEEIKEENQREFLDGIEKISKGYPLQYITNSKEFMKMNFYVDEKVLVPRSDTEILVEEVIFLCQEQKKEEILELCTGSGAISVSLSKFLSHVQITATDISEEALEVAKKNGNLLLKENKIEFIQSDMFENINKKYDVIVSNPPYIRKEVIKEYNLKYEPQIALDGRRRWT